MLFYLLYMYIRVLHPGYVVVPLLLCLSSLNAQLYRMWDACTNRKIRLLALCALLKLPYARSLVCAHAHRWQIQKTGKALAIVKCQMDSVPQNLAALKRPALQKLCKQLGLKANGKVSHKIERDVKKLKLAKAFELWVSRLHG